MAIEYIVNDTRLDADTFLGLVQAVWPRDFDAERIASALRNTINVTAWDSGMLIGCVRVLSDGYLFGTVPEILVRPDYQGRGVGRRLMELAWEASPTSLFFGAQPGNEGFFEKLGYLKGMQSYYKKKPRA